MNEVIIARSLLPTTTANNKAELAKLADNNLSKKGDLDSFAHKCSPYPKRIIEEMKIVKSAVEDIIGEHAGKKMPSFPIMVCPIFHKFVQVTTLVE